MVRYRSFEFAEKTTLPIFLLDIFQIDYRMEPAGSHGVHSLDDFQFLCFLFGSIQLGSQNDLQPCDFPKPEIIQTYSEKFMFLQAIEHINSVKTGMFSEHSNTLWGISGVRLWDKVQNGFMKMYKAEVLGKFPVMQVWKIAQTFFILFWP